MGLVDRLRAMFGAPDEGDKERAEEEELAVERVEDAIEREKAAALGRVVPRTNSLDEEP